MKNSFRLEIANYVRAERNRRYQRNPFDESSHEVLIANYTSRIRSCVEVLRAIPNDAMSKFVIMIYKKKRTKLLNELYRMDRKRYDVLIKELTIGHVPGIPGVMQTHRVFRKASLRKLTDEYCHKMKKEKLEAYHEKLKQQQEPFMQKAEETKKWIEDEMRKYCISEDDVTPGFKPIPKFRDPTPVRPLVHDSDS